MPQVRKGWALCEGLSAVSASSGFEDLLSLSSGWTFEGQLSTVCCRIGAGSSTGHFEDHRWRSGWSGAPKGSGSCLSACGRGGQSSAGCSCWYVSFLISCYLAIIVVYCLCAGILFGFQCGIRHFAGCGFGYGLLFWEFRWLSFMRVISGNPALGFRPGSICFLRSG